MRILLVTSGGLTGSLSHQAYSIAEALHRDFEFGFICDGEFFEDRGTFLRAFEADRRPDFRVPTPATFGKLAYNLLLKRSRYDVIHFMTQRYLGLATNPRTDILGVADIFPFGLEAVAPEAWNAERKGAQFKIRNISLEATLRLASVRRFEVFVYARTILKDLCLRIDYPETSIHVVPYILDPRFRPVDKEWARARLGLARDARVVLAVGSSLPRKNLPAMYYMINHINDPVDFVKIGDFDSSQVFPTRRKWVRHLPVVDSAVLPLYYSAADLLFFPSIAEGFGVPVLEAMTCGVPIVAADAAVVREVADGAALYAPHNEFTKLLDLSEKVLERGDVRTRLRAEGLKRASALGPRVSIPRLRERYLAHRLKNPC